MKRTPICWETHDLGNGKSLPHGLCGALMHWWVLRRTTWDNMRGLCYRLLRSWRRVAHQLHASCSPLSFSLRAMWTRLDGHFFHVNLILRILFPSGRAPIWCRKLNLSLVPLWKICRLGTHVIQGEQYKPLKRRMAPTISSLSAPHRAATRSMLLWMATSCPCVCGPRWSAWKYNEYLNKGMSQCLWSALKQ